LLTSPRLVRLLTELRGEADLVVVDSAAVLPVADALELARACDLTVLVARSKMSRGRDLGETIQRIDRVGGSTAGVVLNAIESELDRTRDDRDYGS
jgi:Mrp family chromosome partitioning ATPase